jgi:hypothetical protein
MILDVPRSEGDKILMLRGRSHDARRSGVHRSPCRVGPGPRRPSRLRLSHGSLSCGSVSADPPNSRQQHLLPEVPGQEKRSKQVDIHDLLQSGGRESHTVCGSGDNCNFHRE